MTAKIPTTHSIDARGKALGRVASEAASVLMGKMTTSFARNRVADLKVSIVNASLLDVTDKKKRTKTYIRYSGYPDGKRVETLAQRVARKGMSDALRDAVYGMLPGNRLRALRMKNLSISD